MISPIYEKLSQSHPDVGFGKIDVDDNSDAAMDFNVSVVVLFPKTFIVFLNIKLHIVTCVFFLFLNTTTDRQTKKNQS